MVFVLQIAPLSGPVCDCVYHVADPALEGGADGDGGEGEGAGVVDHQGHGRGAEGELGPWGMSK